MLIDYTLNPVEWILTGCLAATVIFLIRFYAIAYAKVYRYKNPQPSSEKKPVSVVLSGKNQYEYLRKNLAFWLEQKYPDFEVIVVYGDTDEDVTSLLKDFARRYPRLVLINANQSINFFDEQKFSLSIGAKSAHNEYIIMTHPQFRPDSEYCIDYMQAAFKENTRLVVGHAVFSEKKKKVCGYMLFRTLEESAQFLGFAAGANGYTGRQCLIGYRKSFFLEHQGFSDSYALNCVEFDRFKNRIRSCDAVGVQLDPKSKIKFTGKLSFGDMLRQAAHYRITLRASAGKARSEIKLYGWMRNLYFWFLAAAGVYFALTAAGRITECIPLWCLICAALAAARYITHAAIMQKTARTLGYGRLWPLLSLYSLFTLFLQLIPVRSRGRRK